MLGEIVLPQWKCIAELMDNSIDSFIEARRAGVSLQDPTVAVTIPTGNRGESRLSVRDNGPGMDAATLERAARAGWTSHDPINNLGLFGMGFNIATARLGSKTTIWTTRSGDHEWVGLEIDFDQLTRRQNFLTPALSRPKPNADLSGTEVSVDKLKPEQLDWFGKTQNRGIVSKQLGKIYSSMIGPSGNPVAFRLEVNGVQVRAKLHCVWGGAGNAERVVESPRYGAVSAFQPFDIRLNPRPFCIQCWNWLDAGATTCPLCGEMGSVVQRERHIHGWIGLQRYLDRNEFGVDILRNGRKIEIGNKDLFKWVDESTGEEQIEYPIDDPRDRGRFVGEVHLDHCRVPYTKDRFVREDPAWREMVEVVKGNTPLQPVLAASLGRGENSSPLYRLFQTFRRSNPHNKKAGGWSKILVVPDNDVAQNMAKRFDAGEGEYQTDAKWWELVEEAEAEVLRGGPGTGSRGQGGGQTSEGGSTETLGGESVTTETGPTVAETAPELVRTRIARLSTEYVDDLTRQRYEIAAFAVARDDPIIVEANAPWEFRRGTQGWSFYVDTTATVFRSITFTPLDALLAHVAMLTADFERDQDSNRSYGAILAALRQKYAGSTALDPQELIAQAQGQLVDIARGAVGRISLEDARAFFDSLSPSRQETIYVTMASRGVGNPRAAVDDGRFLQYASPSVVSEFVQSNPELFFDSNYWDDQYSSLDFGSTVATDQAKTQVLARYAGLLADAVWLAQQTPAELEEIGRERLMRASLATILLAPTGRVGEER